MPSTKTKDIPTEEAQDVTAALAALKVKNQEECLKEMQAVLVKYNCEMDIALLLHKGTLDFRWGALSK